MWITQGFFSKGRHMAALGATRVRGLWWVRSVIERFSVTMQEKRIGPRYARTVPRFMAKKRSTDEAQVEPTMAQFMP